jgi:hypothetical protein
MLLFLLSILLLVAEGLRGKIKAVAVELADTVVA